MNTRRYANKHAKAKNRRKGVPSIPCPNCGAGTHVGTAGEVYKRCIPGHIRELLICNNYPVCDSFVAVNQKKRRYGLPADRQVRRLRFIAHQMQDKIIDSGIFTRDELYARMRKQHGLSRSKAHIRYFDENMCNKIITDYKYLMEGNENGVLF